MLKVKVHFSNKVRDFNLNQVLDGTVCVRLVRCWDTSRMKWYQQCGECIFDKACQWHREIL